MRPDVNGGTHKPLATFLSSVLNHSILPEEKLRQLIPWEEQGMEVGFVTEPAYNLNKPTVSGNCALAYEASKHMDACHSIFPLVTGRFFCSSSFIVQDS